MIRCNAPVRRSTVATPENEGVHADAYPVRPSPDTPNGTSSSPVDPGTVAASAETATDVGRPAQTTRSPSEGRPPGELDRSTGVADGPLVRVGDAAFWAQPPRRPVTTTIAAPRTPSRCAAPGGG